MCCREQYTKLEGGSIAIGVIHIFVCIYFFPLGFYNIGLLANSGNEWNFVYHVFAMTVLIFEAVCGWAFSTTLLIGIKKRNPNCLLSYIVWVCLSHFFLNTIFLITTILLAPYIHTDLRGDASPGLMDGLRKLFVYNCMAYYLFGTVSLIIIFKQFKILKERKKLLKTDIDVRYTLQS